MDQIIIAGFLLFIILCFVILFNEKNKFRKLRTEIKAQFGNARSIQQSVHETN